MSAPVTYAWVMELLPTNKGSILSICVMADTVEAAIAKVKAAYPGHTNTSLRRLVYDGVVP
jgi:hypothetical protein